MRAEVGLEYDTNAHRTEIIAGANNPPMVASPLERLVLAGTLSDQVADGQMLTLGATAAGKTTTPRRPPTRTSPLPSRRSPGRKHSGRGRR